MDKISVNENELKKLMTKPLVKVGLKKDLNLSYKRKFVMVLHIFFNISQFFFQFCVCKKYSDMPTELGGEAVEIITLALDKFQSNKNYEVCEINSMI